MTTWTCRTRGGIESALRPTCPSHAGVVRGDEGLRRLLVVERADAAGRVASLSGDLDRLIQSSVGTNVDDEHDPEGATIAFERAQLAALLAASRRRLADLDDAIARFAAGTYGSCQTCGRPISADRLVARPATPTCRACAANGAR
jgi:DnaK suppressor protein